MTLYLLPAPQKMSVFVRQIPSLHCLPLEHVERRFPPPKNKASELLASKDRATIKDRKYKFSFVIMVLRLKPNWWYECESSPFL